MREKIETIGIYIAGGAIGLVLGVILFSFHPTYLLTHLSLFIITLMAAVGLLLSMTLTLLEQTRIVKKNTAARDDAVALIAHEMRTGLTSTGWALQSILDTYRATLREEDKKMIEDLLDSVHATVARTVELLETSLMDIEKLSISLEWVSLQKVADMLTETVEKYTRGAKTRGIRVEKTIQVDVTYQAEVDLVRLRIVIENLLENALQYIGDGKKEITVTVKNNRTTLFIDVADSGLGIPQKEQSKIFSQFFRASNARQRLSTGSGIGLFLVQKFIRAHRGTIDFTSKEGAGTTFHITIPLKTAADPHEFLAQV